MRNRFGTSRLRLSGLGLPMPRALLICALGLTPHQLAAQDPLSAIDWLSHSLSENSTPVAEPDVSAVGEALPSAVFTATLDGFSLDGTGTLSPEQSGLPLGLWGLGNSTEIATRLTGLRGDSLPAMNTLLTTVLLAKLTPPADRASDGLLLRARVDKLLALGALEPARALLDTVPKTDPELFRRGFDIAMLTGREDASCAKLQTSASLASSYPARIFCLARSGDWDGAALTLRMALPLGYISPAEEALLARFLDPDLYEGEPLPALPNPITPLDWRMLEAIGEGLPTATLPLAFAHAELRDTAGWKAQVEAAERLSRAGAITPAVLARIYTARQAAASGGVWDRVEIFQRLQTALASGNQQAVEKILPEAWRRISEAELEVPFAALIGPRLTELPLSGAAADLSFRIQLLGPNFAKAAQRMALNTPGDASDPQTQNDFLRGLALGQLEGATPYNATAKAIATALRQPKFSKAAAKLVEENRTGEALLLAMEQTNRGIQGDLTQLGSGLALLSALGQDEHARRIGLQLLLLERRG